MSTKFFTNAEENTLINKFEGVFTYNPNIKYFDALVGYLRASGYFRIRPFLDKVPNIRILVGINVDKMLANAHQSGLEFFRNHDQTREEFLEETRKDIAEASYDRRTEMGILQFIDDIVQKKIAVKAHPSKRIHAKVYILRPEPFNEHTLASAITGSSNLTDAGLGGGNVYNYEFNVQLTEYADVVFATEEFEKLWAESVDILPVDIQGMKQKTYLNTEINPFDLYIKLLMEYFGNNINYDPDSIGDLPIAFKKLSYQIDAVNEGFDMLSRHNGFILADVVGLGKTVIAAMVAKKFLIENGRDYTKILVVYPPAVEKNWKDTFKDFNIDKYTKFITNGSLEKILNGHQDYWAKEEYDLVIADEAHKFRNHTTGAFENLQLICKSPRANHGLISGSQKKVILVSATPLNNRPDDIFYQIQMFQDARQSTLPKTNLTAFFSPLMEKYKELKRFDALDVDKLRGIYADIRKNVIEPITIRRTRTDLENIAEYKLDLDEQGIKFPKVEPPQKVEYVMGDRLNVLFHKTVLYLTDESGLKYSRYQAIAGLSPDIQRKYYENAETVSKSLAFIMKTQLIKRLESSFYAFKKSLNNFKIATDRMIVMFENDKIFIAPSTNVNKLLDKGWSDEEIEAEIERLSEDNPKNQTFLREHFQPEFVESLQKDAQLLDELVKEWEAVENDPKLDVFLAKLNTLFFNKTTNLNGKLVIFSESKNTVDYLSEALAKHGQHKVLVISSKNRKQLYDTIVTNFDANCVEDKQVSNYNIIITTEVLAEGVNLHRSNVVIHYDTPWNSTKLMQRIGRVNRIGTKANAIYNYVFYPSAQGDSQIKLNKTAFMKIQAFHTAFGEDSQVFSTDEILDEVKLFSNNFKEDEDKRLKYLFFLRNFRKKNKAEFERIKKLPLKSRVGRNAKDCGKPDRQDGTIAFLKTAQKFEFYWIGADNQPQEITAIRAFEIFEADQQELAVELIAEHHAHVQSAITHFENTEQEIVRSQIDPLALGAVAQKAKKFLAEIAKHPQLVDRQRQNIQKLLDLIDVGKYANLAGEVDKLQKKKLNLNAAILEIDKISEKYSVNTSDVDKGKKRKAEKPVLIISESFK